jgi:tetratricopeptide (TPR) repeat protein
MCNRSYNPVVNAETEYLFRHALLCEAAYQLFLPTEREALHGQAFRLIDRRGNPLQAALHALAALPDETSPHRRKLESLAGRWAARAIAKASADYNHKLVEELAAKLKTLKHARPRSITGGLQVAAQSLRSLGRTREAIDQLEWVLSAARQHGHRAIETRALISLAELRADTGDLPQAESAMRDVMEHARAAGDTRNENAVRGNLAVLLDMMSRHEESMAMLHEAMAVAELLGDRVQSHSLIGNMGIAMVAADKNDEGIKLLLQALELADELKDVRSRSFWLGWTGKAATTQGRFDDALAALNEAIAICRQIGFRMGEASWLAEVAKLDAAQGNRDAAASGLQRAIAMAQEMGAKSMAKSWQEAADAL